MSISPILLRVRRYARIDRIERPSLPKVKTLAGMRVKRTGLFCKALFADAVRFPFTVFWNFSFARASAAAPWAENLG
ncbi:hypothetical protein [Stappia sp. MMSF_3263]|uniref:hypothetical protein n=1 Tax=Stappia sp. MMSF_3263 TaxID=3046693 RepID=UPI00273EA9C0|nr:hypothetical protein [Stappia sp. MMSF_3263]